MNSNIKIDLLFELQNEIHQLENMVLYYTNRIARKQIALAELVESWHRKETEEKTEETPELIIPTRPTYASMVLEVMNGEGLSAREIHDLVATRYPTAVKNKQQIHSTIAGLRMRGKLNKDGHLFYKR